MYSMDTHRMYKHACVCMTIDSTVGDPGLSMYTSYDVLVV